jgi:hemoglobin-like flavoprotein
MSAEDHFEHFFEIVNRRYLEALGEGLGDEPNPEILDFWMDTS